MQNMSDVHSSIEARTTRARPEPPAIRLNFSGPKAETPSSTSGEMKLRRVRLAFRAAGKSRPTERSRALRDGDHIKTRRKNYLKTWLPQIVEYRQNCSKFNSGQKNTDIPDNRDIPTFYRFRFYRWQLTNSLLALPVAHPNTS
jgi:hypothetical protein